MVQVKNGMNLPVFTIWSNNKRIVKGSSQHDRHARRSVKEIEEWLLRHMVEIHF